MLVKVEGWNVFRVGILVCSGVSAIAAQSLETARTLEKITHKNEPVG